MNHVVLGGKSGLGAHLVKFFEQSPWGPGERVPHKVLGLGRPEIDFRGGWVNKVKEEVQAKIGDPSEVDTWVINAYDHHADHNLVQENILMSLWPVLRDYTTDIVVIGSMSHYYQETVYAKTKKRLMLNCTQLALQPRKCRLVLIEPSVLENTSLRYPSMNWMSFDTLCNHIADALEDRTTSYSHLALIGNEKPPSLKKD